MRRKKIVQTGKNLHGKSNRHFDIYKAILHDLTSVSSTRLRRIWVMADPPHGLKNLRNHILDKGIRTRSGERVDRPLMRQLLQVDGDAEMRLLHKIHPTTHVEVGTR